MSNPASDSSSLAAQLNQIYAPEKAYADLQGIQKHSNRPSLLYEPREAADLDDQDILGQAIPAFQSLACQPDSPYPQLRPLQDLLFSPTLLRQPRQFLSAVQNAAISAGVRTFFKVTVGSFLKSEAVLRCTEWLIRGLRVHILDVAAMLDHLCCYHDDPVFVRLLQLLDLSYASVGGSQHCWQFLLGAQQTATAPTRSMLVKRCREDVSLVCVLLGNLIPVVGRSTSLDSIASSSTDNAHCIAICSEILLEYLDTMKAADLASPRTILPICTTILKNLSAITQSTVSIDGCLALLMLLSRLACKVQLSSEFLECCLKSIVAVQTISSPDNQSKSLLLKHLVFTVLLLLECQDSLNAIPSCCQPSLEQFISAANTDSSVNVSMMLSSLPRAKAIIQTKTSDQPFRTPKDSFTLQK